MLIGWAVFLIAVAGVLMRALSANPTVRDLGLAMMWCGLAATCMVLAGRTVRLL